MFFAGPVANAINYATNQGIHILNASFAFDKYEPAHYQAISNYPGLFVAAAGNNGTNNDTTPRYPASYVLSNIISVGASTEANTRAIWTNGQASNYGKTSVHLFAPGDNILSTTKLIDLIAGPLYGRKSGTSMAAPQVTGVAALMLSKNPNLTPLQIRTYIVNNVDTASAFSNSISGGRLNAQRALAAVPAPSP